DRISALLVLTSTAAARRHQHIAHAAIDQQIDAADMAGMRADEEQYRIGHILRQTQLSQRNVGLSLVVPRLILISRRGHWRVGGAWRYGVAADAVRPPFDAELANHHQQGSFTGRIKAERGRGLGSRHGRGGYESALALLEMRMGSLTQQPG